MNIKKFSATTLGFSLILSCLSFAVIAGTITGGTGTKMASPANGSDQIDHSPPRTGPGRISSDGTGTTMASPANGSDVWGTASDPKRSRSPSSNTSN